MNKRVSVLLSTEGEKTKDQPVSLRIPQERPYADLADSFVKQNGVGTRNGPSLA